MVERAVRESKRQERILHSALCRCLGVPGVSRRALVWSVAWDGGVLTGTQVGRDGMTPYRRLRGRSWQPRLAKFGEQVLAPRLQALLQANVEAWWDLVVELGTQCYSVDSSPTRRASRARCAASGALWSPGGDVRLAVTGLLEDPGCRHRNGQSAGGHPFGSGGKSDSAIDPWLQD